MVPQHSTVVVSKRPDRFFSIQYVIRRVAYLTKQKRKKTTEKRGPYGGAIQNIRKNQLPRKNSKLARTAIVTKEATVTKENLWFRE